MGYKIIDNFLSESDFLGIKNEFFNSHMMPWYFNNYTTPRLDGDDPDIFQFTHLLYQDFRFMHSGDSIIRPLLQKLAPFTLIRIKLNLLPKRDRIIQNSFHRDHKAMFESNCKYSVGIFYLNNNNGFTVLEDGTKIESVENRMLLLSGDQIHTGTTSTDERRCLINFNFVNKETENLYNL